MNRKGIGAAALASAAMALMAGPFAGSAAAHHSFAMFDAARTVEMEGTVKEFQWTNPHSWLQVLVTDEAGHEVEWSLEMGSPGNLARAGWRPRLVAPGDHVTVTMHPLKDGSTGGQLLTVTLPDGTVMEE